MDRGFRLQHRHKSFEVIVEPEGGLALYVDQCLRKHRPSTGREPQYVWTNIELEWEEHHYIEARYWAGEDRLVVTVNGDAIADGKPQPIAS